MRGKKTQKQASGIYTKGNPKRYSSLLQYVYMYIHISRINNNLALANNKHGAYIL